MTNVVVIGSQRESWEGHRKLILNVAGSDMVLTVSVASQD